MERNLLSEVSILVTYYEVPTQGSLRRAHTHRDTCRGPLGLQPPQCLTLLPLGLALWHVQLAEVREQFDRPHPFWLGLF